MAESVMPAVTHGADPQGLAWVRSYARRVFVTDLLIIEAAVFGSKLIRFGFSQSFYVKDVPGLFSFVLQYNAVSAMIVIGWMLSLEFFGARYHRIIGSGSAEYKAIVDATIRLFCVFAIIVYLVQAQIGRSYLLMALPTGLFLLLSSRWLWRQWLIRKRGRG